MPPVPLALQGGQIAAIVEGVTALPHDIGQAVQALARCGRLPFDLVEASASDGRISLKVQSGELRVARAHFEQHPVVLRDGRTIAVHISETRAQQFDVSPLNGDRRPEGLVAVPQGLVGMDVVDAARLATAAGWYVRAYEPGAAVTLDLRPGRLNLAFNEQRRVTHFNVG